MRSNIGMTTEPGRNKKRAMSMLRLRQSWTEYFVFMDATAAVANCVAIADTEENAWEVGTRNRC